MTHDPERLEALADAMQASTHPAMDFPETAAALREYAKVVRVLSSLDIERRANAVAFNRTDDGSYVAQLYDTHEGDWSDVHGTGPTLLTALLALADELAKEGK